MFDPNSSAAERFIELTEDLIKGRKALPVGHITTGKDGIRRKKQADGTWKPVKGGKRKPKSSHPTKKHVFSQEEGVIRFNRQKGYKEISVRGEDGKMRPKVYKGTQRPGGKAPEAEIKRYQKQETQKKQKKTIEGTVRVKDGVKQVAIFDSGKVRYFKYMGTVEPVVHGVVTPENIISKDEIERIRRINLHGGEKEPELPPDTDLSVTDYPDLKPQMPYPGYMKQFRAQSVRTAVPREVANWDDSKPLGNLLTKVNALRYEITLSRRPVDNTYRPRWFNGTVIHIKGKGYFRVRHYQNLQSGKVPVRRYVLTKVGKDAYATRTVRFLRNRNYKSPKSDIEGVDLQVGEVRKTKKGFHIVVTDIHNTEKDPDSTVFASPDKFVVHGRVLKPSEVETAKEQDPTRQKKTGTDVTPERAGLARFKNRYIVEEDTNRTLWDTVTGLYELEKQDLQTDVDIAENKVNEANRRGLSDKTKSVRRSRLQNARDKLENFSFEPYSYVKTHAIDSDSGLWVEFRRQIYYQRADFTTWRTSATVTDIRDAIKDGAMFSRKFLLKKRRGSNN